MSRRPMQREDRIGLASLLFGIAVGLFAAAAVTASEVRWPTSVALAVVGATSLTWGWCIAARIVGKR